MGLLLVIGTQACVAGEDVSFGAIRGRQLKVLSNADASADSRVMAVEWLGKNIRDPGDGETVAALEKCMKDANAKVRARAVEARGNVAMQMRAPCPVSVIEAMLDGDAEVREHALNWSGVFPPGRYSQDAAPALLRCVKSDHQWVRSLAVLLLAELPKKDETFLKVARQLASDKHLLVRNDAQSALYRMTGKLDDIVPYCLRLRVEARDAARIQTDKLPKEEQVQKNLVALGVNNRLYHLVEDRTDDLARHLFGLLADNDATLRRVAAVFLADWFRGQTQPAGGKDALIWDAVQPSWPFDPEAQRKKREAAAKKHVTFNQRLGELGLEKRLRQLRDADSEALVRGAAAQALVQWEAYQRKKAAAP